MTTTRLLTYALGIVAVVAAVLLEKAQAYLLPVGTALLGLATQLPEPKPPLPKEPVDSVRK